MKKLLLVLLLLPVALSAQIQTWKIKGALAALNDTVPAVNIKALDKLIDWGVLDSLVHARAIPQKIFD